MRYNEETVQRLSEHLNVLARCEYGVHVVPVRVKRGTWAFKVTDLMGGDWVTGGTKAGYDKVKSFILSGF